MADQPQVVSATELDNGGFVGETIQVSIVTDDIYKGMDQLIALGIGPFTIFEITPENSDMHYRGEKTGFSMKLALTTQGSMMWEVVEPTGGRSIYQDFLDEGHKGLHHVGVDCNSIPYAEQQAELKRRGYEEIQGGTAFNGQVPFSYYHSGEAESPWVEIFEFPEGFEPQIDEWYPAPPPAE